MGDFRFPIHIFLDRGVILKEENSLRVFNYLEGNYKGLTLELYRLGSTIVIDRRFIQEALQYDDHRQLARMRSNFPEEFDKEYIPEYIVDGTGDTKMGLYTP